MGSKELIMVVDDNEDFCAVLSETLEYEGYEVDASGDAKSALFKLEKRLPDLVLLDVRLPGMDGLKALEEMKRLYEDLRVILLTAHCDVRSAVRAMKLGACDYLTKPFDDGELRAVIRKALSARGPAKGAGVPGKKAAVFCPDQEAKGESPSFAQVLQQVRTIATTNMTVILQGESGTGKELIARMIHSDSFRKEMPFVAIDCGTLPETLAESELFGYEKGAFTGADCKKEGQFEAAKGGTLFLDEITNLSDSVQAKLLRVIQERSMHHLGGNRNIALDVRIIVATNLDFSTEVRKGNFRADLYHRLNEFSIVIPPLRERREDIIPLALHFLDEANREFKKDIKGFSNEASKILLDYDWPGNIRELKNLIRRAALLTDSDQINPTILPKRIGDACSPAQELRFVLEDGISLKELTGKLTRDIERQIIEKALEQANNNKALAARILKIDRMTLYSKIRSFKP